MDQLFGETVDPGRTVPDDVQILFDNQVTNLRNKLAIGGKGIVGEAKGIDAVLIFVVFQLLNDPLFGLESVKAAPEIAGRTEAAVERTTTTNVNVHEVAAVIHVGGNVIHSSEPLIPIGERIQVAQRHFNVIEGGLTVYPVVQTGNAFNTGAIIPENAVEEGHNSHFTFAGTDVIDTVKGGECIGSGGRCLRTAHDDDHILRLVA